MKSAVVTGLLLCLANNTLANPLDVEAHDIINPSIQEKQETIKKDLTNAVQLLKEVAKEQPAFGQPLSRATQTIDTLAKAIENLFQQHKQGNANPVGGYGAGGPRYGGRKPEYS